MSVEEDSRQEWTFTLYDFDNNGKVTREVSAPAWAPTAGHAHGLRNFCPVPDHYCPFPLSCSRSSGQALGSFRETGRAVPELPGEWGEVTEEGPWGSPVLSGALLPGGRSSQQAPGPETSPEGPPCAPTESCPASFSLWSRALGGAWDPPGHFPTSAPVPRSWGGRTHRGLPPCARE